LSKLAKQHQVVSQRRGLLKYFHSERRQRGSRINETYAQYLELRQSGFYHFTWWLAIILAAGTLLLGFLMITEIRKLDKASVYNYKIFHSAGEYKKSQGLSSLSFVYIFEGVRTVLASSMKRY